MCTCREPFGGLLALIFVNFPRQDDARQQGIAVEEWRSSEFPVHFKICPWNRWGVISLLWLGFSNHSGASAFSSRADVYSPWGSAARSFFYCNINFNASSNGSAEIRRRKFRP